MSSFIIFLKLKKPFVQCGKALKSQSLKKNLFNNFEFMKGLLLTIHTIEFLNKTFKIYKKFKFKYRFKEF